MHSLPEIGFGELRGWILWVEIFQGLPLQSGETTQDKHRMKKKHNKTPSG
jgi:hypothetical protein